MQTSVLTETQPAEPLTLSLRELLGHVRACQHCVADLPLPPRPVLRAHQDARLLVVGQAPGRKVHQTGIPWNDASGERLRDWLGIPRAIFYDASKVAIIPMGYCYPGKGRSGDLAPRKECAALWLDKLLAELPALELTLLIGQYAQAHYLGPRRKGSLTDTVRAWRDYLPAYWPLPHPSPRNIGWRINNPWFDVEVLPALKARIITLLG